MIAMRVPALTTSKTGCLWKHSRKSHTVSDICFNTQQLSFCQRLWPELAFKHLTVCHNVTQATLFGSLQTEVANPTAVTTFCHVYKENEADIFEKRSAWCFYYFYALSSNFRCCVHNGNVYLHTSICLCLTPKLHFTLIASEKNKRRSAGNKAFELSC